MRTPLPGNFSRPHMIAADTDGTAKDDRFASAHASELDAHTRGNAEARGIDAKRVRDEYLPGGCAGI